MTNLVEDLEFGNLVPCPLCAAEKEYTAKIMTGLDGLETMTFEAFDPTSKGAAAPKQRDALQMAWQAAKGFSLAQDGWLVLIGGSGAGKTHLAVSIGNQAQAKKQKVRYFLDSALLDWLQAGMDKGDFERRMEELRTVDLLILDDYGVQQETEWVREKLFAILDSRYQKNRRTLLTMNDTVETPVFDLLDSSLRSRLHDAERVQIVDIQAPDYRNPYSLRHEAFSSWDQYADRTFENFDLRTREGLPPDAVGCLRRAKEVCQKFADKGEGWILLMGDSCAGKSHLAAAMANQRIRNGQSIRFMDVSGLLEFIRFGNFDNSQKYYNEILHAICEYPFLILDELPIINASMASSWEWIMFEEILVSRYNYHLPTIITTCNKITDVPDRISHREKNKELCLIVDLKNIPPYSGKVILHKCPK